MSAPAERDIHYYCKKGKAFAWAKYYDSMRRQADIAVITVRQHESGIPSHFSNEFIEMAKELRKQFECPVCLEMVNGDTIDITCCGHIYCKMCLTALKRQTDPKCAMCRKKITAS